MPIYVYIYFLNNSHNLLLYYFPVIHQISSIVSSLVSMGWAMASYHRSIRLAQQDKSNIGVIGIILQFLWHFCITGIYSIINIQN